MSRKARVHLSRDPRLKEIIEATKLKRRVSDGDVYASLIRTIVYQQLSGKAASTIHGRFLALFPDAYPRPEELLKLSSSELRQVGLSGQKSRYVRNVASYWVTERLHECNWSKQPDDEVVRMLTKITGVGTWSAQMILMFTLQRPDVFPVNDLGIRNAIVKRYRLRSKGRRLDSRLVQIAEAWRPYRTLACRYLWSWLDN